MLCGSLDGRGFYERMDTCICRLSPFAVHLTTKLLVTNIYYLYDEKNNIKPSVPN